MTITAEARSAEAAAPDALALVTAERDTLREFLAALIELHLWQRGAWEHFTAEDIWHHATRCGLVVPDPHPQTCPIEGCECGDYDGELWRLAWMPPTALEQEVEDE